MVSKQKQNKKNCLCVNESAFRFSKRSFSFVTTNNLTSQAYSLAHEMHWELVSWWSGDCQGSYSFWCCSWGLGCWGWCWYHSCLSGWYKSGPPLILSESRLACDAGLGQSALNALTYASQVLGNTRISKWQISIWIDKKDTILNVCYYYYYYYWL